MFLAHLSRRLIGKLIVYKGIHPSDQTKNISNDNGLTKFNSV